MQLDYAMPLINSAGHRYATLFIELKTSAIRREIEELIPKEFVYLLFDESHTLILGNSLTTGKSSWPTYEETLADRFYASDDEDGIVCFIKQTDSGYRNQRIRTAILLIALFALLLVLSVPCSHFFCKRSYEEREEVRHELEEQKKMVENSRMQMELAQARENRIRVKKDFHGVNHWYVSGVSKKVFFAV
ncbi:MAG: hypothetical protein Q4B57_01755 [Eubacteriales bacterium]|nr:hypothetical protein [Eubacteriales bacterium]